MEVIMLDSSAYKELTEKIERIYSFVRENAPEKNKDKTEEVWIGNKEVKNLLGISTRTLQRLRENKRLDYAIFSGACRYRCSDIERLIEDSTLVCTPEQLEDFKKNYRIRATINKKKG